MIWLFGSGLLFWATLYICHCETTNRKTRNPESLILPETRNIHPNKSLRSRTTQQWSQPWEYHHLQTEGTPVNNELNYELYNRVASGVRGRVTTFNKLMTAMTLRSKCSNFEVKSFDEH